MNKKTLSIVLLCFVIIVFALTAALCIDTALATYSLKHSTPDTASDSFPGATILKILIAEVAIWGGFCFFGFLLGAVGWLASLAGIKIATSRALHGVFIGYACFYGALLLLIVGIFVYCVF